jgi:hypothetical protein
MSQWLKSRKKAVAFSLIGGLAAVWAYLLLAGISVHVFYATCFVLGLAGGYWAVLVTVAAEQFGTNLRATAATAVPNFVRASVILLTSGFLALRTYAGAQYAALFIGTLVFAMALFAVRHLQETFGKNLDFIEELPNGFAAPVAAATHEVELNA